MKLLVVLVLVGVALAQTDEEHWSGFKSKFGKSYGDSEEPYRFQVFKSNLRKAEEMTRTDTAVYGVTQFSDLTVEEFRRMYANLNVSRYAGVGVPAEPEVAEPVVGVNWISSYGTTVKNQGSCGSCWAFSATAATEGCEHAAGYTVKTDLSAQQVVDCKSGSGGCNGDDPYAAVQYCENGLTGWNDYPYKTAKGTCASSGKTVRGKALAAKLYTSETTTNSALSTAPVSICVDADPLQSYSSGIVSSQCTLRSTNHAVLLVANDNSYYTVKNSWGASWGESGFFRLAMNQNCLGMGSRSTLAC